MSIASRSWRTLRCGSISMGNPAYILKGPAATQQHLCGKSPARPVDFDILILYHNP
jgi:hypothetical protein